jgi:hypothetical protein
MTTIEITRFHSGKRGYTKADACKVPVCTETRLQAVVQHIDNAVKQLRYGNSEPRGLSFASYRGSKSINKESNLNSVHALALDYKIEQFEELAEAADRLGFAHLFVTTENRAQTQNAITLVIPFTAPLNAAQYARLASCIATELGIYGLLEGALAATHIINVYATTMTVYGRGALLDAAAYIKRTANQFQGMDARRFERAAPPPTPAVAAQIDRPFYITDDGLFEMPMSDADLIVLNAHRSIYGTVPDLTNFGRLLDD